MNKIDINALNSVEIKKAKMMNFVLDVSTEKTLRSNVEYFANVQDEKFIFDENNTDLVIELIKYFNGNECKLDLSKGICLFGNYGTGKSYLLRAIQKYIQRINIKDKNIFRIASIEELINSIEKKQLDTYLQFKELNNMKHVNLCIDEFGSELDSQIKFYGSPAKEHIERFLMRRYELFAGKRAITHITTNLTPELMAKHYSQRLVDRFIEMFNIIEVKGESKRK